MAFRTYTDEVLIAGDALHSFTAEEAVQQGQLVKPGAADSSVEPSDTDGEFAIGFAQYDAAAGEMVSVATGGCIVRATSGTGSVSAGAPVTSHGGTGEEGELAAAAATGDKTVGVALADDAGTNDDVVVLVDLGAGGDWN
jgi:hypothetical protein